MATIEDLSLIPDTFSSVLFADYFDFTSDPPATKRLCFFFFQAEDGIRDTSVTGVQTCGLPIYDVAEHAALLHLEVPLRAVELLAHEVGDDRQRDELRVRMIERRAGRIAVVLEDEDVLQADRKSVV